MRGSIARQSCAAREKCASSTVCYKASVCEAHFFYDIGNCCAIPCHNNTLRVRMRTRMRGSIARQSCAAREKCASSTVCYKASVCEAHFFYDIGNCCAIPCHNNTLRVRMRTRMRGSIASQSYAAREKCASSTVCYKASVCEAHFCCHKSGAQSVSLVVDTSGTQCVLTAA